MMSRSKHKNRNVLHLSKRDTFELCRAVETRFKSLRETYFRTKFEPLDLPTGLDAAMILWRTMAVRFKRGDYRNTQEERSALEEIAQWTVDENNKLKGQPAEKVQFDEE